jgi:hypothetical protein
VVLPAKPDNFGNVPVGKDPDDYHPRSQAARDLTHQTGNAGNRIARGVITSSARQLRPEEPPRTTGADLQLWSSQLHDQRAGWWG